MSRDDWRIAITASMRLSTELAMLDQDANLDSYSPEAVEARNDLRILAHQTIFTLKGVQNE